MRWADTDEPDEANPKTQKSAHGQGIQKLVMLHISAQLHHRYTLFWSSYLGGRRRITITDVALACLNAPSLPPTFVEIVAEEFEDCDEGRRGELQLSMYGMCSATQHWQRCDTGLLVSHGFKDTRAFRWITRLAEKDIGLLVHGDDRGAWARYQQHEGGHGEKDSHGQRQRLHVKRARDTRN